MKNKIILSASLIALAFFMLAAAVFSSVGYAQIYNSQAYGANVYGYNTGGYAYGSAAADYYVYPNPNMGVVITQPSYYTTSYYGSPYAYGSSALSTLDCGRYGYSCSLASLGYASGYSGYGGYPYQQYGYSGYGRYSGYTNARYCEDPNAREGETRTLGINLKGEYVCANGRWMFVRPADTQGYSYSGYGYVSPSTIEKLAFYRGVLEPPYPYNYNYKYNAPVQSAPLVYATARPVVETTLYETSFSRKNCKDPYGIEGEHKIIGLSGNEYACQRGVWVLFRDNSGLSVEGYTYYQYGSYGPTQYIVEIKANGFNPGTLSIKVGDTVTFINKDAKTHWPASDYHPTHNAYPELGGCIGSKFDACHEMLPNSTYMFTFNKVGIWGYHDHLDPFQTGTVRVQ